MRNNVSFLEDKTLIQEYVNATRKYNFLKHQYGTKISKINSSSIPYQILIDEVAFLSNIGTEHCFLNLCISKISHQSIVECVECKFKKIVCFKLYGFKCSYIQRSTWEKKKIIYKSFILND